MFIRRKISKKMAGFAILVMALVLISVVSVVNAADKPITLKFSAFFPEPNTAGPLVKEFCRRLEQASKGTVKVNIYWAGALGPAKEQLDIIRGGLADLALAYPVYNPASFQRSLFIELPLFASKGWIATKVVTELINRDLITDEFKTAGVQLLSAIGWPPSQLYSNKKIAQVEDFKGLRIWSSGPVMAKTCSLVGGSGITLTWADIYTGLERGTLDAFPSSWGSSVNLKLYEVTKYPVNIGFMGGYLGTLIMNKASWNKLSPDVQTAWRAVGKEFAADYARILDDLEEKKRQVWTDHGREVIEFPAAEKEKLAQKLVVVWQEWIDRGQKEGDKGKTAKEIYKTYAEIMNKVGQPVMVKIPGLYE